MILHSLCWLCLTEICIRKKADQFNHENVCQILFSVEVAKLTEDTFCLKN